MDLRDTRWRESPEGHSVEGKSGGKALRDPSVEGKS